jgi:hypothetical protein
VLDALVDAGEFHPLAQDICVAPEVMARSREAVRRYLLQHKQITVGQARDLLDASRKCLLPFLEQLDREGLTLRQGDYRVLWPSAAPKKECLKRIARTAVYPQARPCSRRPGICRARLP